MNSMITPGSGLIFMKVGTHAQESLAEIIKRKTKEIAGAGFGMWGYGGNTCHPATMVQPFARAFEERGQPIHLVMEEMDSKHYALPLRADKSSVNGIDWEDIPAEINVRGSRFALVIDELRRERFTLDLARTQVGMGLSIGRNGSRYVQGRVDKACLEVIPKNALPNDAEDRKVEIHLVARLRSPYAVFVKEDAKLIARSE